MKGTCEACGRKRVVYRRRRYGRVMCSPCTVLRRYHDASTHERCAVCNRVKPVLTRKAGNPICQNCHRKDASTHERCIRCSRLKPVARRTVSGPLCKTCYLKDSSICRRCIRCGRLKPAKSDIRSGRPLCHVCHRLSRIGICAGCGKKKFIQALKCCSGCYQQQRRAQGKKHH